MAATENLIGKILPDSQSFSTNQNESHTFNQFRGQNLVLYFYPKDNTPGCTQESKEFAELYNEFRAQSTEVFGVSRDNLKSHDNFRCTYNLPFYLISDENQALCKFFSVLKEKNMFGKKSFGIERSTFLIDKHGIIRQEWRKVSPKGHAIEVLEAVKTLEK